MVIGHEITHGFDDEGSFLISELFSRKYIKIAIFFVIVGRHYDKIGRYYTDNEQGLWTQHTIEAFKKKTKCMIDQYNSFNVTEINRNVIVIIIVIIKKMIIKGVFCLKINGVQTLGENIADNGGIKEAYRVI